MFVSNCKREIEKSVARVSGGHWISSKTIKEEDKYTFPRCTLYSVHSYSVQSTVLWKSIWSSHQWRSPFKFMSLQGLDQGPDKTILLKIGGMVSPPRYGQ